VADDVRRMATGLLRALAFASGNENLQASEFFLPDRKLYEKFGFDYCQPFADYRPDPYSVFMTRVL